MALPVTAELMKAKAAAWSERRHAALLSLSKT